VDESVTFSLATIDERDRRASGPTMAPIERPADQSSVQQDANTRQRSVGRAYCSAMQERMYAPPLHAIAQLVNYVYDEERRSYVAHEPEDRPFGHIFESVWEVARWLWPDDGEVAAALEPNRDQLCLFHGQRS
jgi:hypothetical protein